MRDSQMVILFLAGFAASFLGGLLYFEPSRKANDLGKLSPVVAPASLVLETALLVKSCAGKNPVDKNCSRHLDSLLGMTASTIEPTDPDVSYRRGDVNVTIIKNVVIFSTLKCGEERVSDHAAYSVSFWPKNVDVLPENRRKYKFDNVKLTMKAGGQINAHGCAIVFQLPSAEFRTIVTGQYGKLKNSNSGFLWRTDFEFP